MNAPGIKIKKSTALAAPIESPREPLSKNGVKNRDNENMIKDLGQTILKCCEITPGGVLIFFSSY
jgi:Rad3-related DNA helicase